MAIRPNATPIPSRTRGVADRMDPAHLAAMEAMRAVTGRLFGRRGSPGTDDPAEQERLLAEGRRLIPAYVAALKHMEQVAAEVL